MALDPILIGIIGYCRGYHGLSYDESLAIAKKAISMVGPDDDESDLFEMVDLVWGASLAAGKIEPGDWNVPVDPREPEDAHRAGHYADQWAMSLAHKRVRPVEYTDPTLAIRKPRRKKRRTTPDV